MTYDEFYLRFLHQVRPVDRRHNTVRQAQPARAAQASLATAIAAPPVIVEGRVVGRIDGGRIVPIEEPAE